MGADAAQIAAVFELIADEDETPLVSRDAILFLDYDLNALDGVSLVGVKVYNFAV